MMHAGLLAEFDSAAALIAAARALRARGYRRLDAYTPYPVEGVEEALALPRSPLPRIVFPFALAGAGLAYLVQWAANAWAYPLVAGGRPPHAAPMFVPIAFETCVLAAALAALVALLVLCRLPELWHPVFAVEGFERASIDRFWLGVDAGDPRFDRDATAAELRAAGALRVAAVPAPAGTAA